MFLTLENIALSGKDGFVIGDHNGRHGEMNFNNRNYETNIGTVINAQGKLLALFYDQCSFYP